MRYEAKSNDVSYCDFGLYYRPNTLRLLELLLQN